MNRFWDWVDRRRIVHRLMLFITLWMTWEAFHWATMYASTVEISGMDAAAIIAAVTAPISALQGYVFKVYSESRKV